MFFNLQSEFEFPKLQKGLVGGWAPQIAYYRDVIRTNHGSPKNGAKISHKYGRALYAFDGTNDYVDFGTIATGDPLRCTKNNQITIALRMHHDNGNFKKALRLGSDSNGVDGYALTVGSGNNDITLLVDGANAVSHDTAHPGPNVLFHLVVSFYGFPTNDRRMWVNAIPQSPLTGNNFKSLVAASAQPFDIGSVAGGSAMGGGIQELYIWDRLMEQEEVSKLYHVPFAPLLKRRKVFPSASPPVVVPGIDKQVMAIF